MRKLFAIIGLLSLCSYAYGKAARFDNSAMNTNSSAPPPGGMYPALAISGAQIAGSIGPYHFSLEEGGPVCPLTGCTLIARIAAPSFAVGTTLQSPSGAQPSGTLQREIDSVGANGTIVLPAGYRETATTAIRIKANNVTLRCEPGATLIKGGNETLLAITGTGDVINGCTLDGNKSAGFTGDTLVITGSHGALIENSTIRDAAGINLTGSNFSGSKIINNHIYGALGSAVEFTGTAGPVSDLLIQGNTVDDSAGTNRMQSKVIGLYAELHGSSLYDIQIHDNLLLDGPQFCVEWGRYGGAVLHGIQITDNRCVAETNAEGCYSGGDGSWNDTIKGNTCDANKFSLSIAAYEVALDSDSTWSSNTWTEDGGRIAYGISLNSSSNDTISGNVGHGWQTVSDGSAALIVDDPRSTTRTCGVSGSDACYTNNNTISSNTFSQEAGDSATRTTALFVQSTRSNQEINNNKFTGNTFTLIGASGSAPYGIYAERDAGSFDSNKFTGNTISGAYSCVNHDKETNALYSNNQCLNSKLKVTGAAGPGTRVVK
ncbi:MAG: right-handed parallel beta-helix repeat-containing protein [Terriglobia bacterium]